MLYMFFFQYDKEPILIHRILIGFKAKLENILPKMHLILSLSPKHFKTLKGNQDNI